MFSGKFLLIQLLCYGNLFAWNIFPGIKDVPPTPIKSILKIGLSFYDHIFCHLSVDTKLYKKGLIFFLPNLSREIKDTSLMPKTYNDNWSTVVHPVHLSWGSTSDMNNSKVLLYNGPQVQE